MNALISLLSVLAVLLLLSLLSHWTGSPHLMSRSRKQLKLLVREGARYCTISEQDSNSIIAVLHATYGVAYLQAAKELVSEKEILSICNVDINELIQSSKTTQHEAIKKLMIQNPQNTPISKAAIATGWIV